MPSQSKPNSSAAPIKTGCADQNNDQQLRESEINDCPHCVAAFSSSPAPAVMRRQKKDAAPQPVLAVPPELDVSMVLEFVG